MYGNYRGQCIGRLLHFMYEYHIRDSDIAIFDGDTKTITVLNKLFAEYSWDKDEDGKETDIPTFKFHGEHAKFWENAQQHYKGLAVESDRQRNELFNRKPWKPEDDKYKPQWLVDMTEETK